MDYESLLERMLLGENVEPTYLPISLLESITNKFSNAQRIGSGGFAVVYKGLLQNCIVAVKKLKESEMVEVHETKFIQEVHSLMRVKHKNIVQFLGYCADTQGKMLKYEGKNVMVEERQRFLCFEFLPEGSLDKYISDASRGLEWMTRYQIIKGLCEGLHYLHEQKIVHSDLKPANILMDFNMVPKIADFGLARFFDDQQTRAITSNVFGSQGYMAAECYSGIITFKSDIYSLGVIIIEILTGHKGYPEIENVLESWSTRFKTLHGDTLLGDTMLECVRVCAEIGIACIDSRPANRPITQHILEKLDEMEGTYGLTNLCTSPAAHETPCWLQRITTVSEGSAGTDNTEIRTLRFSKLGKLLDVYPLKLRFPFKPNKSIKRPLTLTNRTDRYVGIRITPSDQDTTFDLRFPDPWDFKCWQRNPSSSQLYTMEPHSTVGVLVAMKEQQHPPSRGTSLFEVQMVVMGSEECLQNLEACSGRGLNIDKNFVERVEILGGEVYRAMLTAVICDPASSQVVMRTHQFIPMMPEAYNLDIIGVDVHPTEPLLLRVHGRGRTSIWNYETQEIVGEFELNSCSSSVFCATFINRPEQWFAAGDSNGRVHVYAYTIKDKVKEFEAFHDYPVTSIAVHSTCPFMLTATLISIKLWDWGNGWICTQTFNVDRPLSYLMFNPGETSTFASVDSSVATIYKMQSSDPITAFEMGLDTIVGCYTDCNRGVMVTCDKDGRASYIRDFHTGERLHKLHVTYSERSMFCDIACHPTLPLFVTSDGEGGDGHVYVWDARTYRLLEMFHFTKGDVSSMIFIGTKDTTRILFVVGDELATAEINLP